MIYSQRDPIIGKMYLGKSKLDVRGYGCFLTSIANLYGVSPVDLLKVAGGVTDSGLVNSAALAQFCGGVALPKTITPPKGWSIAMTNKYAPDFPTHFFCVNFEKKLQIDPLDYPAQVEPLSYPIVEYRPFTNIKLIDVPTWQDDAKKFAMDNGIITGGWDAPDAPMSQVRVAAALKNMHDKFLKS